MMEQSTEINNNEIANNFTYLYGNADIPPPTGGLNKKDTKRLIAQVKQQAHTMENLRKENEELRSTERLHSISLRQAKDAARRVYIANQAAEKAKKNLVVSAESHVRDGRALAIIREEVGALHDENRTLRLQMEEYSTINRNLQRKC